MLETGPTSNSRGKRSVIPTVLEYDVRGIARMGQDQRRRNRIGSFVVGTIFAIAVYFVLLIAEFVVSLNLGWFGPARSIEAVAIGGNYSIDIKATATHPWLAEYDQAIEVYSGGRNDGRQIAKIEIDPNTGGRVRIGVFIPREGDVDRVVFLQRHRLTAIDLEQREFIGLAMGQDQGEIRSYDMDPGLAFLGWISGEAYPVKFIPCSVWPKIPRADQLDVVSRDESLLDLCERFPQ